MTETLAWYARERDRYTELAVSHAFGADPRDEWDPERGWRANRDLVVCLYDYYRDLFNRHPDRFLWAGLARLAGGAVVGGLDAIPNDRNFVVRAFLEAGRDIFYALGWQHEAAAAAPDELLALARVLDAEAHPRMPYARAWARIVKGTPPEIARGNEELLENEQYTVAQPHSDTLCRIASTRSGPLERLLRMSSMLTLAIHPYHRDFAADFPTGDPRDGDQRWAWITLEDGMWRSWTKLPAQERIRLVNHDFEAIVRGDFGNSRAEAGSDARSGATVPLTLRRLRLAREILLSYRTAARRTLRTEGPMA